jgi:hypothetical protein
MPPARMGQIRHSKPALAISALPVAGNAVGRIEYGVNVAIRNCTAVQDLAGEMLKTGKCGKQEKHMNRLILSSVAVAALTLSSVATVSAQLSLEQRSAVRIIIVEQLTDEMQNRLPGRIAEAAAALSTLTPDQRAKIGSAIRARLGDDVREGLPERLSEALADGLGKTVQGPREAKLTPEQRAAIRNQINERLGEDMREKLADRLADAAAALAALSPEQRATVLNAVRARLADEVRGPIGERLADAIGQKLADRTVGSGAK